MTSSLAVRRPLLLSRPRLRWRRARLGGSRAAGQAEPPEATGFAYFKYPTTAPSARARRYVEASYFQRDECGYGEVTLPGLRAETDVHVTSRTPTEGLGHGLPPRRAARASGATRSPPRRTGPPARSRSPSWSAGVEADGSGTFFVNQLGAELAAEERRLPARGGRPAHGRDLRAPLRPHRRGARACPRPSSCASSTPRATLRPRRASSRPSDGSVAATLPGALTAGLAPDETTDYRTVVRLELVDAVYDDPDPLRAGAWGADDEPAGNVTITVPRPSPCSRTLSSPRSAGSSPATSTRSRCGSSTTADGRDRRDSHGGGARRDHAATPPWDAGTMPAATGDEPGSVRERSSGPGPTRSSRTRRSCGRTSPPRRR